MSRELLEIRSWLSKGDRTALLTPQPRSPRAAEDGAPRPVIEVDPLTEYQSMDGFGFALTGGSALLIGTMPEPERTRLLKALFSPEGEGIGISMLRVSLGASDLSEASYSYDDLPPGETDPELAHFSLKAGDPHVIPLLQAILAVNPAIRIIGSPWSPPPWMKTGGSFVGGRLLPECRQIYARYLVKFVAEMKANGIVIHALTPQNEPRNRKNEPSMEMDPGEQAVFIKDHLGPALREAGLEAVELFCWDHNCDEIGFPLAILADAEARKYIAGVAWHLYAGEITALSEVHAAYPLMKMYFTEQWVGSDGNFAGDLRWHFRHVLIGATRNWSRVVLEWNLASDPLCGPHTEGGEARCVGALTIGQGITRNVSYYVIAHAAKFVPPGSQRIGSNCIDSLPNVAFRTPDGNIVLIVLNDGTDARAFDIAFAGRRAREVLDAGAAATYVWPAIPGATVTEPMMATIPGYWRG